MNNVFRVGLVAVAAMALVGCASNRAATFAPEELTTVRVITETAYPVLAPINKPPTPKLKPVKWDYPRQVAATEVIRNTTECLAVPKEQQDLDFWAKCGIDPIDLDSNIFVGLSQEDFNNLTFNLETLRQHIGVLEKRIDIANAERAENNAKARKNK